MCWCSCTCCPGGDGGRGLKSAACSLGPQVRICRWLPSLMLASQVDSVCPAACARARARNHKSRAQLQEEATAAGGRTRLLLRSWRCGRGPGHSPLHWGWADHHELAGLLNLVSLPNLKVKCFTSAVETVRRREVLASTARESCNGARHADRPPRPGPRAESGPPVRARAARWLRRAGPRSSAGLGAPEAARLEDQLHHIERLVVRRRRYAGAAPAALSPPRRAWM